MQNQNGNEKSRKKNWKQQRIIKKAYGKLERESRENLQETSGNAWLCQNNEARVVNTFAIYIY